MKAATFLGWGRRSSGKFGTPPRRAKSHPSPPNRNATTRRDIRLPTYCYTCPTHGDFDRQFSMKDFPRETPCPECGKSSAKGFIRPLGVLAAVGAATTPLDSRSIRNRWQSGFTPQYGHFKNTYELAGREKRDCDDMNQKQNSERWKVERSVLDGAGS